MENARRCGGRGAKRPFPFFAPLFALFLIRRKKPPLSRRYDFCPPAFPFRAARGAGGV